MDAGGARIAPGTISFRINGDNTIPVSPPAPASRKDKGSHDDASFGVVYVNDIGREAMSSAQLAKFPIGSIIVREKLAKQDDTQPQLLAVMIKRATGFNPRSGDWEYLVVDGAMTKIRDRQKTGTCYECHSSQQDRDFVFPLPAK